MITIEDFRRIVKNKAYEEFDGVLVDMLTANMMVTIYDALSVENQFRLDALLATKPIAIVTGMCWKLVK